MTDLESPSPDPTATADLEIGSSARRGASLAGIGWISSQGLTFAAYIALARLVTHRQFGDFAAGSVLVSYGFLFSESGMLSALIARRDRIQQAASSAFFALVLTGVLLTAAAVAASPLIGLFFQSHQASRLALALAPWLFLRAMAVVPDALLQRRFSFARRVAVDPLGAIAFAAGSIVGASLGWGAWSLVAGTYASEVVEVTSSWLFAGFRPRRRHASIAMWRELASFARPVVGAEILRQAAAQMDTVVLGRVAGLGILGQYRNGMRLAQQPSVAFMSVGSYVLLPALARLRDRGDGLREATLRVFSTAATAVIPISVAMVPLGVPLAVIFLGNSWRPAGHAIAGLSGMLVGTALVSISAEVMKALQRPQLLVRIQVVGLVSTVVGVLGLGIPFGLLGVALAISASQVSTGLYSFEVMRPLLPLTRREVAARCAGPIAASAGMLAAMLGFERATSPLTHPLAGALGLTVAEVLLAALIYVGILVVVDRPRRDSVMTLVRSRRGAAA